MTRIVRLSAAALLAAALTATACAKKKPEAPAATPTPPPPVEKTTPAPPPPPKPAPPAPTPPALTEDEIFAKTTLEELNAKRPLGDVFFVYDSIEITSDGRATLQKNSEFLKRWPSTKVMVEGHADSRGTNEYNLALGERRAAAVRDYLVSLGLDAGRTSIVSKGEEQPQCGEETDACWQKNRRGTFIFTAK
jgi:peptidoglycan-associated lipoprotein